MKIKEINKILLLVNITVPSILCFLVSYFFLYLKILTPSPGFLVPLFFGIILGAFNSKYYGYKIFFYRTLQVILISIGISYLCFSFSFMLIPILVQFKDYLFKILSIKFELVRGSIYELYEFSSLYIIAPLSILLSYKYIFKFPKRNLTRIISLAFLVFFPVLGYVLKNIISSDTLQMLLWMPLMILPIQLILYQKELKRLFKLKT